MYSFVQSLFSACVAGLVVWYLMRRGSSSGGNTASTTAEIERLRAVVEELTAALEKRAESAEQRLGKMITEAQAVQGLLDRTLAKVGAQIVRPETPETGTSPVANPAPVASIENTPSVVPEAVVSTLPPVTELRIERAPQTDGPARPAIRTMSAEPSSVDLLTVKAQDAAVRGKTPEREPDVRIPIPTEPVTPVAASTPPVEVPATEPVLSTPASVDEFSAAPVVPPFMGEPPVDVPTTSAPEPSAAPTSTPTPAPAKSPTLPGSREPKETAEREARVMSMVARGITNSVEIARQTGLTRGEVELILTLHNLHIAPGREGFAPAFTIPEEAVSAPSETVRTPEPTAPVPDQVPVNPDDRYAAIYALIAAGVTDSVEIARRTGLGRGEVELHMGLHARKVL